MNIDSLQTILAAGALGDAFGYAVEFHSWNQIKSQHGPQGLRDWPLMGPRGVLTASDDTQMTLFAVEALRESLGAHGAGASEADIEAASLAAFLRWHRTQNGNGPDGAAGNSRLLARPEMHQRQAPGNTCLGALGNLARGLEARNQSKGCGAAMRAAPYAILAPLFGIDFAWRCAFAQGDLTHRHVDGAASGAALAFVLAREPKTRDQLAAAALEAASRAEAAGAESTANFLRMAVKWRGRSFDPEGLCDALGEGWVGDEAVAIGLWAALATDNATDAIRLGANHRGDSDSTASMAGQFSACVHGLSSAEWAAFDLVDLAPALREEVAALRGAVQSMQTQPASPKSRATLESAALASESPACKPGLLARAVAFAKRMGKQEQ